MHPRIQQQISLAALFMAALIAFQSAGWFLAWQGLQFAARLDAHHVLAQKSHTSLESTFQHAFFQKIKIGRKEIRLNGQLFDYIVIAETADSVQVALYHDQHEQALLSAFDQVLKSGGTTGSTPPIMLWLAKWIGSAFILPEKRLISPGKAADAQKQVFPAQLFMAQSAPSIFAPPPERKRA